MAFSLIIVNVDRQTGREAGRQTDRHDEANSPFLQFCERA
jgi:hypothetical protein